MNSSPLTGLQLLFQTLFNCFLLWSLSSSQRTLLTHPQAKPSTSNLCAFAKAIPPAFSSWPLYPKFTYSAGPSSYAGAFKSSYVIALKSFRYEARKEWMNEHVHAWINEQMIPSPKSNAPFLLSFHCIYCGCYILLEVGSYFISIQKTLSSSYHKAQCQVGWGIQQWVKPSPAPAPSCSQSHK